MTRALSPCPSCARHVRGEDACPFCGAAIPLAIEPEPRVLDERVSRGVLHALGFAVGTATIVSAAVLATGCIMARPLYGAPAPIDAGHDASAASDGGP